MNCPHCGKVLNRKRVDRKRITTLQSERRLERPYFYCSGCGCGQICRSQPEGIEFKGIVEQGCGRKG